MQLEIIILSMSERERQIPNDITCMWNLNYGTNELIYKIEADSQTEIRLVVAKGEGREMEWEFGVGRCKLLHLEWISNKVLLYSTGNYIHYTVINRNGEEYQEKDVPMWIPESLCCTAEMGTTL